MCYKASYLPTICIILYLVCFSRGECPNACSGHGKCGLRDMCQCYRNWIEGDCSGRICPFGRAHVDSPQGDLNSDGVISGPDEVAIRNSQIYPFGTSEKYSFDFNSEGVILPNSGHAYRECSNKGICVRTTGLCSCQLGYSGPACQYLYCPFIGGRVCHGHGVCESAARLSNHEYILWDEDALHGCKCDPGYYGPACSSRACPINYDPILISSGINPRFSNWSFVIFWTSSPNVEVTGNFSIIFYDVYGKSWLSDPIQYLSLCDNIIETLESLPNNVIPSNTVVCSLSSNIQQQRYLSSPIYGIQYTLSFPGNPGILRQPDIHIYLDGKRPSLFTNETKSTLSFAVYPNGFQGETNSLYSFCLGVKISILTENISAELSYSYIDGLSDLESRLLARCLGVNEDQVSDENIGVVEVDGLVYRWDYGSQFNPHLVKLVVADEPRSPGFMAALFYSPEESRFIFLHDVARDYSFATEFLIYTSAHGPSARMIGQNIQIITNSSQSFPSSVFTKNLTSYISTKCPNNPDNDYPLDVDVCLEKGMKVFILDPSLSVLAMNSNPSYINIHTILRIKGSRLDFDVGLNAVWTNSTSARMFVVIESERAKGIKYVSECSNRGNCNENSGVCSCYDGYTGAACESIKTFHDNHV